LATPKDLPSPGVEAAWKAGIVVVVAAGGDRREQHFEVQGYALTPANDPYVITWEQ